MNRRQFLQRAGAFSISFAGLRTAVHAGTLGHPLAAGGDDGGVGYGPLVTDPLGVLDLPAGFSYVVLSPQGMTMDDGLLVPGNADGMAAFPGPEGRVILVRNHELTNSSSRGPYGANNVLFGEVPPNKVYDRGSGRPPLGGTTTLIYDPRQQVVEHQFLSLAGTMRNCAGGPTPWGSWLSCEENVQRDTGTFEKDHGYVFEVPARARGLVVPEPLIGMGRFNHEAAAVDPRTGIVYLTEDRGDSLLYRFVPHAPGRLALGGRLQALKIRGHPGLETSNHSGEVIPAGQKFSITWIDLEDVTSPADDLRLHGALAGAAVFTRGEGTWWGDGELFFTCTDGGRARRGQIWRLRPSHDPLAGVGNRRPAGRLELFLEPNNASVLDKPDNMTVGPNGHLFVCEDGSGRDSVLGVSHHGEVYPVARNARSNSELAGATFSPDGQTLFVNEQSPGTTFAIIGPW